MDEAIYLTDEESKATQARDKLGLTASAAVSQVTAYAPSPNSTLKETMDAHTEEARA